MSDLTLVSIIRIIVVFTLACRTDAYTGQEWVLRDGGIVDPPIENVKDIIYAKYA